VGFDERNSDSVDVKCVSISGASNENGPWTILWETLPQSIHAVFKEYLNSVGDIS
jgi:hypothetical protein